LIRAPRMAALAVEVLEVAAPVEEAVPEAVEARGAGKNTLHCEDGRDIGH